MWIESEQLSVNVSVVSGNVWLFYALNVMRLAIAELEKLEVMQNKAGRTALGANRWVAVEAIYRDMG